MGPRQPMEHAMSPSTVDEIAARVRRLPEAQQAQALAYVRTLERATSSTLAAFAGSIPAADLDAMRTAIEADCEGVDATDW